MVHTILRRLERLEARAKEVAAAAPKPHTFLIVNADKRVTGTFTWENGKSVRTDFETPRDPAEFEMMV
jgi:hypothetical protein